MVSVDDKMGPDVMAFVKTAGLDAPVVYEELGTLYEAFGVEQLPQTYVVDRAGRILMESRRSGEGARVPSWHSPQVMAFLRRAKEGRPLGLPSAVRD